MPTQPYRTTRTAEDITRHYTQSDFTTVLKLEGDMNVSPGSDITQAVTDALTNNGNDTLIVFDAEGHYTASGNITAPKNVTEWGVYSPPDVMTTIRTDYSIPNTAVTKGLFGGYIIERQSQSATQPAVALHVDRPGPPLTANPTPGYADLVNVYTTSVGEDRAIQLSTEDASELFVKDVVATASTTTRAAIEIPTAHHGNLKLETCETSGFQTGILAPNAHGGIHVERGAYADNTHGARLAGANTAIDRATIRVTKPGGAGVVWDAGTAGNDGGEIRDCEITVDGGRTAIAAADIAGHCTIAGCEIEYETAAQSGAQTGAVIDAPSPTPTGQNAQSDQLVGTAAWDIHSTTITGNGEPQAVIWLTDRPDSSTRGMTIHMNNTDGIVYDGDTTGIVENSIINVWGTTMSGTMDVRNIDEVATPGATA